MFPREPESDCGGLSDGALEEVVKGRQDGVLLAARQALDQFHPLENLAAGLALLGHIGRGVGLEQFLDGHFEGGGEPQRNLCGDAELAYLVIGNDNLDDVDALGQLSLAQSAQAANVGQTLAEGKVDGLVGIFGGVLTSSHDKGECKSHVEALLTMTVNHFKFMFIY